MRTFQHLFPYVLVLSLAGVCPLALGDNASHHEAATDFYLETREDPKTLSATVTRLIGQLQPGLAKHRKELEAFALEILDSQSYIDAQVGVYMDLLTEEELRTLTWLFRHETMRRYRSLKLQLVERNTQAMLGVFRRSLPELQRRIDAKRGGNPESSN